MKERDLLHDVRAHLSIGDDVRLFRMTVGFDELARQRYGVPGMSDLIGWRRLVIVPADVGTELAVFTAIELKSDRGKATAAQLAFLNVVHKAGGFAGVARNLNEARAILRLTAL